MARDILGKQTLAKLFLQVGGARPDTTPLLLTTDNDGQARVTSINPPVQSTENYARPSDTVFGKLENVGTLATTPEDGTMTIEQDVKVQIVNFLEQLLEDGDDVAAHIVYDFTGEVVTDANGFKRKVLIPTGVLSSFDRGDIQSVDSDSTQTISADFTITEENVIIAKSWVAQLDSTIERAVSAVCFGNSRFEQFAFERGDGASVVADLHWRTGRNSSFATLALTGILGHSDHPNDAASIGSRVIVVAEGDKYAHAPISGIGTLGNWSVVTAGFVATKTPNKIWVKSAGKAFFAADGGYIYTIDGAGRTPTAVESGGTTTQDLLGINGAGQTVVAVGGSNAVLKSTDGGQTFGSITGPSVGNGLTTVWVRDEDIWFIGDDAGNLYYTVDAGVTWVQSSFTGSGSGTVEDIFFVNEGIGFLSHTNGSGAGKVYQTTDGGASWENDNLTDFSGTVQQIERVVAHGPNSVMACGLGTSTDGIFAIASGLSY